VFLLRHFRIQTVFGLLILTSILLVSCQTQPQVPMTGGPTSITITGHDFSFTAPEQIEAGLTTIIFENEGQEPHHLQLVRLNDGVTPDQFFQDLEQQGEAAFFMLASAEGGAGVILHGDQQEITIDLQEGTYLLVCLIPSPDDGIPHIVKGMVQPLQVVASAEMAEVGEPQADLTITMNDFSFDMPSEINTGPQVWRVVNEGVQWHEINVVRLAPGATIDDVNAYFMAPDGPPPFEPVGGLNGFSADGVGWVTMDLEPGSYVAICYIPDPGTGHPHFALGMIQQFEVR
jgi:hypothetical protein